MEVRRMKPVATRVHPKKTKKIVLWSVIVFAIVGTFALTQDIIFTNILAAKICRGDPQPKTFIKKTVEFPESIYWEDNIYPGFDEKDRLLMIRNYLDGEHLKTMALNAPDGTIYLFTATPDDWQASREIKAKQKDGNYSDTVEAEAKTIASRGKIINKQELSQLNYSVLFNPISLTPFQNRYLYSDEVSITMNVTKEVIAYNLRLMHKFYLLLPDFVGGRYYYPEAICGESDIYGFDEKIFTSYKNVPWQPAHLGVNRHLFKIINKSGGKENAR